VYHPSHQTTHEKCRSSILITNLLPSLLDAKCTTHIINVGTSDVEVTSLKRPEGSFTTQGYIVPGRLDDELDTTTSASSWVEVVRRRKPVVKQSGAVLTLFTKRK
jgi:hypothetical protein